MNTTLSKPFALALYLFSTWISQIQMLIIVFMRKKGSFLGHISCLSAKCILGKLKYRPNQIAVFNSSKKSFDNIYYISISRIIRISFRHLIFTCHWSINDNSDVRWRLSRHHIFYFSTETEPEWWVCDKCNWCRPSSAHYLSHNECNGSYINTVSSLLATPDILQLWWC